MSGPDIKLIQADPGFLVYYTLDELTRRVKSADPSEWGICGAEHGAENFFWLAKRAIQSGKDVLRLSLRKILERRSDMHPEWPDEKVYIFVGVREKSHEFAWFLLNEEEALPCIAGETTRREVAPSSGDIVHQVLLADLNSLAELWEVSSDNLGLEINADGDLVPKIIDGEDDIASLTQIQELAEEVFPNNDELDLVVEVQATTDGVMVKISTMDYVCSPAGRQRRSRWCSFTDTYKDLMDS